MDRFMEKVQKTESCWLWTAGRHYKGYGLMGKGVKAHRVAYRLFKGEIPAGAFVCHSCDNPPCVNPDHLWVGTNGENVRDARSKGRLADMRGMKNPHRKLTLVSIAAIRDLYKSGQWSCVRIAGKFGVNQSHIWRIVREVAWQTAKS